MFQCLLFEFRVNHIGVPTYIVFWIKHQIGIHFLTTTIWVNEFFCFFVKNNWERHSYFFFKVLFALSSLIVPLFQLRRTFSDPYCFFVRANWIILSGPCFFRSSLMVGAPLWGTTRTRGRQACLRRCCAPQGITLPFSTYGMTTIHCSFNQRLKPLTCLSGPFGRPFRYLPPFRLYSFTIAMERYALVWVPYVFETVSYARL